MGGYNTGVVLVLFYVLYIVSSDGFKQRGDYPYSRGLYCPGPREFYAPEIFKWEAVALTVADVFWQWKVSQRLSC